MFVQYLHALKMPVLFSLNLAFASLFQPCLSPAQVLSRLEAPNTLHRQRAPVLQTFKHFIGARLKRVKTVTQPKTTQEPDQHQHRVSFSVLDGLIRMNMHKMASLEKFKDNTSLAFKNLRNYQQLTDVTFHPWSVFLPLLSVPICVCVAVWVRCSILKFPR